MPPAEVRNFKHFKTTQCKEPHALETNYFKTIYDPGLFRNAPHDNKQLFKYHFKTTAPIRTVDYGTIQLFQDPCFELRE